MNSKVIFQKLHVPNSFITKHMFGPSLLKKGIFLSKVEKMWTIIKFSIFKLVNNGGHNILVTTMVIITEIELVLGML